MQNQSSVQQLQQLLHLFQQQQQQQQQQNQQPAPAATANVTATTAIVSTANTLHGNAATTAASSSNLRSPKLSATSSAGRNQQSRQSRAKTSAAKKQQQQPPSQQQQPLASQLSPSLTQLKLNLDAATGADTQPLSSVTSLDEGVLTSWTSPAETASGAASPTAADDEHTLPREHENASRKRPTEIQNLLLKKNKRIKCIDAISDILQKKVSKKNRSAICNRIFLFVCFRAAPTATTTKRSSNVQTLRTRPQTGRRSAFWAPSARTMLKRRAPMARAARRRAPLKLKSRTPILSSTKTRRRSTKARSATKAATFKRTPCKFFVIARAQT